MDNVTDPGTAGMAAGTETSRFQMVTKDSRTPIIGCQKHIPARVATPIVDRYGAWLRAHS